MVFICYFYIFLSSFRITWYCCSILNLDIFADDPSEDRFIDPKNNGVDFKTNNPNLLHGQLIVSIDSRVPCICCFFNQPFSLLSSRMYISHFLHDNCPSSAIKEPSWHSVHSPRPDWLLYFPTSHFLHSVSVPPPEE
jgi:hypothetical protein